MQTPRAPSSTPRNGLPASKPPTPPSSKKGRLTTRRISHHSRNPGPLPPLSKGGRAPRFRTHAPPANAHRHLRQKPPAHPPNFPRSRNPQQPRTPLPPLSKGGGELARRRDSSRFRTHAPQANAPHPLKPACPPIGFPPLPQLAATPKPPASLVKGRWRACPPVGFPPLPHPRPAGKHPSPPSSKNRLLARQISPAPATRSNPGTPCLPCQREVAGLPAGGIPPLSLRPQQKGPVPRSRGRQALFILAVRFPERRVPPLSRTGRSGRCHR